jgi:hypothetical protein
MKPERKPGGNRLRVGRWYRLRLWGDLASVDLSPRRVNNGWPNDDGLDITCVKCRQVRRSSRRARAGRLVAVDGADHFTILNELRSPDGLLVDIARPLAEERN